MTSAKTTGRKWTSSKRAAITDGLTSKAPPRPPTACRHSARLPPASSRSDRQAGSRAARPRHYLSPLYTYSHDGNSAAIICALPGPASLFPEALRNRLFFADLIQQHVWTLDYDLSTGMLDVEPFADGVGLTTQMLGGPDGNVWFVSFSRGVLARFEVTPPTVQ